MQIFDLLTAAAATGPGGATVRSPKAAARTFQATVTGATPSATVAIEVSNDGQNWLVLRTITLDGVTPSDGFASEAPWGHTRANVTALGAGCSVSAQMGV